jgi:glycosyltransferase involved in cell wall biosynthesis
MKKFILSVTNDLVTDQRVHRVATTLSGLGNEVVLVGRMRKDSLPLNRPYRTIRMRLLFNKGPMFYAEYNIRLFIFLLFQRTQVLVANDLDTLLANFLVSKLLKKSLVYDTHEYFTGVPELTKRPVVRFAWELIERMIFPHLTCIFTVNNSIAKLYAEKYHKDICVVRNIPSKVSNGHWPTKKMAGLPEDKKIIVIQGAGINVDRGAEELTMAMNYLDDCVLLVIGGGDIMPALKRTVLEQGLSSRVIFKPKVPYIELIGYTRLADLGCTLDKDTNINYRFSLPNKLFDYIQAGIPVLCSNLVEVAGIVTGYHIGKVIEYHDPELIAEKINEMVHNEEMMNYWKKNVEIAARELCWEKEEKILIKGYGELLI